VVSEGVDGDGTFRRYRKRQAAFKKDRSGSLGALVSPVGTVQRGLLGFPGSPSGRPSQSRKTRQLKGNWKMESTVQGTIFVTNEYPSEIRLRLEPWGDEHLVPPGKNVVVAVEGSTGFHLDAAKQRHLRPRCEWLLFFQPAPKGRACGYD